MWCFRLDEGAFDDHGSVQKERNKRNKGQANISLKRDRIHYFFSSK